MLFPSSNFLGRLDYRRCDERKYECSKHAWNLLLKNESKRYSSNFRIQRTKVTYYCPEGAISKDDPSAGTAITVAIYSIFNNRALNAILPLQEKLTCKDKSPQLEV